MIAVSVRNVQVLSDLADTSLRPRSPGDQAEASKVFLNIFFPKSKLSCDTIGYTVKDNTLGADTWVVCVSAQVTFICNLHTKDVSSLPDVNCCHS